MKEKWINTLDKTFSIAIAFTGCIFIIRLLGWWSIAGRTEELSQVTLQVQGFIEDLSVSVILVLLVGIVTQLIGIFSLRVATAFAVVLYGFVLTVSFGVSQYFVVTLTPLSTDLFGYTSDDIFTTLNSSGGLNVRSVAKLFFVLLVFAVTTLFLLKKNYFKNVLPPGKLVAVVGMFLFTLMPLRAMPEDFENDLAYHIKMNKLWYLFNRSVEVWQEDSKPFLIAKGSYPFMHHVNYSDSLSSYFTKADTYPNLVFIVVEGLGRDFCGANAKYRGFTPFLDSLTKKSLYWQNSVSNAGRTFGAAPSILGSLPYGKRGLMDYGNEMPDHQTLISLLKPYGYRSNFFYGGNPNFDNLDLFLERQGVDYFLNESNFPAGHKKEFWGYNDALLFKAGLAKTESENDNRLDVYLTLSMHEPFVCPDSVTISEADKIIDHVANEKAKTIMLANKTIFECILFTDRSIESFFNSYSKRPDFAKTIFIITGDHRLIPLPQNNKIERFHVPILLFSPLLKHPELFSSLNAHSSILLSILSLLHTQYGMTFPGELPAISEPLSLQKQFVSSLHIPLIRNKNEVNDFVSGNYFLSDDRLYSILPDMQLVVSNNSEVKVRLKKELREFQAKSFYALENNRLDQLGSGNRYLFTLTKNEEKYLQDQKFLSLDADGKLNKAQMLARSQDYLHCRTLLKSILNKSPNYHDARNLLARTYAWQKKYDSARLFLYQTLKRSPNYTDTYAALADIDFWQNDLHQSLQDVNLGLKSNASESELLSRKARVLYALNQKGEAKKILSGLINSGFENEIIVQLKSKLK